MKKTPFMLIVGENEAGNQTVSVRKRGEGDFRRNEYRVFVEYFKTKQRL